MSNSKRSTIAKALLIVLGLSLSFGIGYLAGRDWHPAPIIIEQNEVN